jgi:hypothetical protein
MSLRSLRKHFARFAFENQLNRKERKEEDAKRRKEKLLFNSLRFYS